jgi:hypothetical protein
MNRWIRLAGMAAAAAAALTGGAATAHASDGGDGRAVFVQANSPTGNAIVAYQRHSDGALTLRASYPTGGKGGRTVGSASDPLAPRGRSSMTGPEGFCLPSTRGATASRRSAWRAMRCT